MAEAKRVYKCSVCQEAGHNKAKCPTLKTEKAPPKAVEEKPQMEFAYVLKQKEDTGDDVIEHEILYLSMDGLMKGIEQMISSLEDFVDENDGLDSDEEDEEEEEYKDDKYYKGRIHYYNPSETFHELPPVPTKEYVEELMNKKYDCLNGLLIKIGRSMGGAMCFGTEISVSKKKLNP